MRFLLVLLSKYTVIVCLNTTDRFIFVIKAHYVFCIVGTKFLYYLDELYIKINIYLIYLELTKFFFNVLWIKINVSETNFKAPV